MLTFNTGDIKSVKVISCGVIIINKENKILACKPFGRKDGRNDIPKGCMQENEEPIQSAIRETFEETGLDLSNIELEDVGLHEYMKNKDLHLFKCNMEVDLTKLKCTSFFDRNGQSFPEVDGYFWANLNDIEDIFYVKLGTIIKNILKIS